MKKTDRELLAEQALWSVQKELAAEYRYLTPAFYYLKPKPDAEEKSLSTDAATLFYDADYVLSAYSGKKKDYQALKYRYLHIVIHCLFGHVGKVPEKDRRLYDGCADLYALAMTEKITGKKVRVPKDYSKVISGFVKEAGTRSFMQFVRWFGEDYGRQKVLEQMERVICVDDHERWGKREEGGSGEGAGSAMANPMEDWDYILKNIPQFMGQTGGEKMLWGQGAGRNRMKVSASEEEAAGYTEILREICRLKETSHSDQEIDPIWYVEGMMLYGNRPIIEPSECTEEEMTEDLVIAIDTSGSCLQEAPRFLRETMNILRKIGRWKGSVWITQCDSEIQDVQRVESEDEIGRFETQEMQGWGGTDFTPVFTYIGEKMKGGEMNPSALIYFSDGYGSFPDHPAGFKTVFVMPESHEDQFGLFARNIPDWIEQCQITDEELKLYQEDEEEALW